MKQQPMTIEEYATAQQRTAIYMESFSDLMRDAHIGPSWPPLADEQAAQNEMERQHALSYATLGLTGEAGEIANIVKKYLRGDFELDELRNRVGKEAGDVAWYLFELCHLLDLNMADILTANAEKLAERQAAGVLRGSGESVKERGE